MNECNSGCDGSNCWWSIDIRTHTLTRTHNGLVYFVDRKQNLYAKDMISFAHHIRPNRLSHWIKLHCIWLGALGMWLLYTFVHLIWQLSLFFAVMLQIILRVISLGKCSWYNWILYQQCFSFFHPCNAFCVSLFNRVFVCSFVCLFQSELPLNLHF